MISIMDIINFYRKENPNRSESTYTTMKYNIVRLEKLFEKDIDDLTLKDLSGIKKVQILLDVYKLNTQIQTIMGIKLFLKFKGDLNKEQNGLMNTGLIDKWNEELKVLCGRSKDVVEKNEMTENEEKNWIDYLDLTEKFNQFYEYKFEEELEKNGLNDYDKYRWVRDFMLFALYIELPPTRIGNYQFMKIREQKKRKATSLDKKFNYLMVNGDGSYQLIFNQYKTSKYLGQITHTIKSDCRIGKIIDMYLPIREIFAGKTKTELLLNKDRREMTQSNITDTLKYISRKIVGKDLSVNLLRHIYITYYFQQPNSIQDKKRIANFMGQTYDATQMEKYNKLSAKIKIEKQKELNLPFMSVHFD